VRIEQVTRCFPPYYRNEKRRRFKNPLEALPLILAIPALALSGTCSQQTPAQSSTQSESMLDSSLYLPPGPGHNDAAVLALFLHTLNEPALLEASKDKSVLSYRATYLEPVAFQSDLQECQSSRRLHSHEESLDTKQLCAV